VSLAEDRGLSNSCFRVYRFAPEVGQDIALVETYDLCGLNRILDSTAFLDDDDSCRLCLRVEQ